MEYLDSFKAAAALSETLSGWALMVIGGSVIMLIGTSYHKPAKRWMRSMYLLFVFGWLTLAGSMLYGTKAQRTYITYLFSQSPTEKQSDELIATLVHSTVWQMFLMKIGLVIFGLWLLFYLIWWFWTNPQLTR